MFATARSRAAGACILIAVAGCASSDSPGELQEPPRPAPPLEVEVRDSAAETPAQDDPAADDDVLGRVAGQPITGRDLLSEWQRVAGRDFWLLVDQLVATRLAFAEAARLGLALQPERLEERFALERERFEAEVEASGEATLEEFIGAEHGTTPARYYRRMRSALARQMIAERAVRAWTLGNENRTLRILVVASERKARELLELCRDGADLAQLARDHSVDESARSGGLVPYLVRQELSPLARLAFRTEVGEIGGPIAVSDHFLLCRVEEEREPLSGDWEAIAEVVEASLVRHPVGDSEFLHWKLVMERQYPVDLGRLLELFEGED